MNIDHGTFNQIAFIHVQPGDGVISREADVLDILSACGENGTSLVMIDHLALSPSFFDLKTGLAGSILLKLTMYQVRAALVCPLDVIGKGKFYEFALETNRGNSFRIFQHQQVALEWLTG